MLPFRPGKVPDKVKVRVLLHIDTLHIQHFLCEIVFHDLVYVKKRDHIENLLFSTITSWWKINSCFFLLRRILSLADGRKCSRWRFFDLPLPLASYCALGNQSVS